MELCVCGHLNNHNRTSVPGNWTKRLHNLNLWLVTAHVMIWMPDPEQSPCSFSRDVCFARPFIVSQAIKSAGVVIDCLVVGAHVPTCSVYIYCISRRSTCWPNLSEEKHLSYLLYPFPGSAPGCLRGVSLHGRRDLLLVGEVRLVLRRLFPACII